MYTHNGCQQLQSVEEDFISSSNEAMYRLVTSGRYLSCIRDLKDATYNYRGRSPR